MCMKHQLKCVQMQYCIRHTIPFTAACQHIHIQHLYSLLVKHLEIDQSEKYSCVLLISVVLTPVSLTHMSLSNAVYLKLKSK